MIKIFLSGFCKLLNCPTEVLKNIIQLMRFEIQPELVTQNKLKWSLSLCMTIPPFAVNTFPVGQAGIMGNKEKILVFMQLTRANNDRIPPHQDPMSLVIPVIYNINQNQTMLANLDKGIHNPNLNQ